MSFLSDLFSTDAAKFKKDAKKLSGLLRKVKKEWIPIEEEEIDAIAFNLKFGKRKRLNYVSYKTGEIHTIFHELVASFGYRTFGQKKGSLVVQSNPYMYSFFIKPKYTEVRINGKRFAYVLRNGTIKNSSGRKVIGSIDNTDPLHPEILIGEDNFGILNHFQSKVGPQERAVQLVKGMQEGVQELFISILFLHLISSQSALVAFELPTPS